MRSVLDSADLADPAHAWDRRSTAGDPTWELRDLFPRQGEWTEAAYLDLPTKRLVEFRDGVLEFLPVPSALHQMIVLWLAGRLLARFGNDPQVIPFIAPMPLRIGSAAYRQPDLFLVRRERVSGTSTRLTGVVLVIEVTNPSERDRERDLVEKRGDYAAAEIPEYWIVDPDERTITVLSLDGTAYREMGVDKPGDIAKSVSQEGFEIDVVACFAAGYAGGPQPAVGGTGT